jgi:CDP-diacylglycerol--serine O-phosphatidyltransferase
VNDEPSAASFLNLPSAITAASLSSGFLAVILASQGELVGAAGAVIVSGILDSFDGVMARRMSKCSPFGAQLDSLADIVAFGVAPALMLYKGGLDGIPIAGFLACLTFVLSGAWRLARFSVIEDDDRFLGLPIPPAAVIAAIAAALTLPDWVALGMTLTMCLLMVSDVPFPTFRTIGRMLPPGRRRRDERDAAAGALMDL